MHLKEDIYKKQFFTKKGQSPKIMRFLSITLFRRIFHKSTYDFRNPHKITDLLIPMKAYFEQKKFLTLRGDFGNILKTNIAITMRILKIEKSAFSTLLLEF